MKDAWVIFPCRTTHDESTSIHYDGDPTAGTWAGNRIDVCMISVEGEQSDLTKYHLA